MQRRDLIVTSASGRPFFPSPQGLLMLLLRKLVVRKSPKYRYPTKARARSYAQTDREMPRQFRS